MSPAKLELHLAQTELVLDNIGRMNFSDERIKKHLSHLKELFHKIKKSGYRKFIPIHLKGTKETIDQLIMELGYLTNNIKESIVPVELFFCLSLVLKEWLADHENYILTTSLSGQLNSYGFDPINEGYLATLNTFVDYKFGMQFETRLVHFVMPEALAKDFLANVAMYHEIGHFVEERFQIIEKIFEQESGLKTMHEDELEQAKDHYREYFCDLFAAQYTGSTCSDYVDYISYKDGPSDTHPSTDERTRVVYNFLNGLYDDKVNVIKQYTLSITGNELTVRYTIPTAKFDSRGVIKVKSDAEAHGVFGSGWICWCKEAGKFPRNLSTGLLDGYKELNELIRLSIRGYMEQTAESLTSAKPSKV